MDFIEEVADFTRGVVRTVERDVEELFPPVPGGLVDSARRDAAKRAEYAEWAKAQVADTDQPLRGKPAFRTELVAAPVAGAITVVVAAGGAVPFAQILGFDPNRKRAVIITIDEPVVISTSQAQAGTPENMVNAAGLGAAGFVLPVYQQFITESASEVWVTATSSTATRVSAWTESFGSGR